MATRPKLIAIVGPTASGKTALALDIAERHNGEIICADSRTIYKGMDIGTAKPTHQEQHRIRHWGLDIVEPGEYFSAADFKRYAQEAVQDISSRGKLPLLVGGTGLYVDSVLYDYQFGPKMDQESRDILEQMTVEQLQDYCTMNNIQLPENSANKRYLIRSIERGGGAAAKHRSMKDSTYIVGIATNTNTLRERIEQRAEQLFLRGVEEEARLLGLQYGWDSEAMTGNIYPLIKKQLEGSMTRQEVEKKIATTDYQLAKRQMTWLRRNPDIMWATNTGANTYINSLLATE